MKSFDEVKNELDEDGLFGDCLVKTEEFLEWMETGSVSRYDGVGEIHNGDEFVTVAFKDNIFDFICKEAAKMTKEEFINKYPYVAWYNK